MKVIHSFYSRNYNKNFFVSLKDKETTSKKRSIPNNIGAIYYLQEYETNHIKFLRFGKQLPKIKLIVKDIFQLFEKKDLQCVTLKQTSVTFLNLRRKVLHEK